jgi:hypothetical protein
LISLSRRQPVVAALLAAALLFACPRQSGNDAGVSGRDAGVSGKHAVAFTRHLLDPRFLSEGATAFDVDGDGKEDVVAGDQWFDLATLTAHAIAPLVVLDPPTQYSRSFADFGMDVDQDGRIDEVVFGFPLAGAVWRRNPGDQTSPWVEHPLWGVAQQESPVVARLTPQSPPVAVFSDADQVFIASPPADRTLPWTARSLPLPPGEARLNSHGLGLGDLDGDGRTDIVTPRGYWSMPADADAGWSFTAADLGPNCAQMQVFDLSGDGLADVVTTSAHGFGVFWHEQQRDGGAVWFLRHEVFSAFSQSHALEVADLDGDGLLDLITGKRMYAHPPGIDPDSEGPRVLYWFEQVRGETGVTFTPHLIDDDSGVGTQFLVRDLTGDGRPDLVISNKRGLFFFEQQ